MEERIVVDPSICNGRPAVEGTRITVQAILEFLGAGDSIEDILSEYPSLTHGDIAHLLNWEHERRSLPH